MNLNLVWFLLIGVLFIGYAILDGFDFGVGILHFFARDERERRVHVNAIAPVWDGNEVWLVTAGGALFAAFPRAYATIFSSLYLAMLLLLLALISRAVSLEFRSQVDSPTWRRCWDAGFILGSLGAALLLGVAVGNLLRGLPLAENSVYTGTFLGLLNPYALLCGALAVVLFTLHGAIYLCLKTEGELRARLERWVTGAWAVFVLLLVVVLIATFFSARHLLANALPRRFFFVALVILLAGTIGVPLAAHAKRFHVAFMASAATIAGLLLIAGTGLYPRWVPSLLDPANSLDVHNAASSPHTLRVMLVIALIGLPLIAVYTVVVHRVFRGRIKLAEESY